MKNSNRKWILLLGLASCLALPGMAMADGWNQAPQKFYSQHDQQHHDRYYRDGNRRYQDRREHRDDRHYDRDGYRRQAWREHRDDRRYDRDGYRRHE